MRRAAIAFVFCLLLAGLVYRKAPTQFLRAESGLYLSVSHADDAAQRQFIRKFFAESYGGHYTPFAFLAEFESAKWIGTRRALWRWRQITVLAVVACASIVALSAVTRAFSLPPREQTSIAAAFSALAVFQPAMIDLVAWPFMVLQLLWLTLLMLVLFFVLKFIDEPDAPRWPWLAGGCAYASMHVSGLGLVSVAAVAAVFGLLLVPQFSRSNPRFSAARKRLALCLTALVTAAAVHAWLMIRLLPKDAPPDAVPVVHSLAAVKLLLGFVFNFAVAGLASFSLAVRRQPNVFSIAYCWPLALLLLGLIAAVLYRAFRQVRAPVTQERLALTVVAIFSGAAFLTLVLLVAAREFFEAGGRGVVPYFNAFTALPRYTIPLSFILLGPLALLAGCFARRFRGTALLAICVTAAAAVTQIEFQGAPLRSIEPASAASHRTAWRLLVRTARECRAARLPVPNLPLGFLTREFADADVASFLPLLRHDLGLGSHDKLELIDFAAYQRLDRNSYANIRSLPKLERRLRPLTD